MRETAKQLGRQALVRWFHSLLGIAALESAIMASGGRLTRHELLAAVAGVTWWWAGLWGCAVVEELVLEWQRRRRRGRHTDTKIIGGRTMSPLPDHGRLDTQDPRTCETTEAGE